MSVEGEGGDTSLTCLGKNKNMFQNVRSQGGFNKVITHPNVYNHKYVVDNLVRIYMKLGQHCQFLLIF